MCPPPATVAPPVDSGHDRCVRTLGVDLATTNGSTGLCEIDWADGSTEVEVGRLTDEVLRRRMAAVLASGGWVAIDAPFGFPAAFTTAVRGWDEEGSIQLPDDRALIRRLTDIEVAERQGRASQEQGARWFCWPLSSVVERITPTTVRCAGLLSGLADGPVDRIGLGSRVVEVYPIASLRLWGVATKRYKQDPADALSALDDLCSRAGLAVPDGVESVRRRSLDDAVDALACAFMARTVACADGATGPTAVTAEARATISREGWIHLPPVGHRLEDLARSA